MMNEDEIRDLIVEALESDDPQFVIHELLSMVSAECLRAGDSATDINAAIAHAARDVRLTNVS